MLQCFLVLHDTESVQVSMILSSSSDETTLGIVPSMNITCTYVCLTDVNIILKMLVPLQS